ncbi:hypothetical protein FMUND_1317 [Fusarium mundagurra]|uniref:Uncharacterized protein n=1 Tax=Fusarium mundagurra TaxID=1567541 RepID=A0A8H5Z674_9HYPO|nr:hypothetical protein FMUND_1317 [Fusarium mundagurra]
MVAVTAIQDEAGAFRNEQDTSDIKLNTFDPDSNAHDGFVVYQSHLASTKHYNKELVFGVTEKKGTEDPKLSNALVGVGSGFNWLRVLELFNPEGVELG